MEHLQIPLSDKEEAILELLTQVRRLEDENENLRDEIKQLKWSLSEQD
jgi:predicted RNase H-like nuclease (RuvC/YqgF family)